MKRRLWLVPALVLLALASCAKPPKAEVDAAEAAVAKAEKSADVQTYAPAELKRAQDALAEMRKELAAKKYDKAKTLALSASEAAEAAIAAAPGNKDRAKSRAAELIATAKKAAPEVEKLLAAALKLKKPVLDRSARSAELAAAKSKIVDAETAFASGEFYKAADAAGSAEKALADLRSAIAQAVQSATRKK